MTAQDVSDLQYKLQKAVQKHRKALLIEGVLLIVLGLAAMLIPRLSQALQSRSFLAGCF
jgi:uncharacterized membrane protein HdeD (DUF308 family)